MKNKALAMQKILGAKVLGGIALAVLTVVVAASVLAVARHKDSGIAVLPVPGGSPSPNVSLSDTATSGLSSPPAIGSPPTRWWSSPAGGVGSTLDVENPLRAANGLKPNKASYCSMLHSSLDSGHNPLSSKASTGVNVTLELRAWLAELEALATETVRRAWITVGAQLLAALQSSPPAPGQPAEEVASAVRLIAQNAQNECKLDLSRPTS